MGQCSQLGLSLHDWVMKIAHAPEQIHCLSSADGSTSLDLWLYDFGGSTCEVLKLDGGHMPDTPFFDPRIMPWDSTPATDIFSLRSVLYVIMIGYWPFRTSPPPNTVEDMDVYRDEGDTLFKQGTFPDVSELQSGDVISGCWENRYKTAAEVLDDLILNRPV